MESSLGPKQNQQRNDPGQRDVTGSDDGTVPVVQLLQLEVLVA